MNKLAIAPAGRPTAAAFATLLAALTLSAACVAPAIAEDGQGELGRLFFTPERRQTLDRQRQMNIQEKQEIPEDPTLTINGVVTRSSGKRTAWINGVAQNEKEMQGAVAVIPERRSPGRIVVQSGEAPPAKARVGDTVNRNSGEATDLLNGGSITLNPTGRASRK
jgi:hypothetical protein